ncbi:MAG TPA: gephyrin-like molybdotransferase Glp [Solirubrobacteraceae bacterium]|nr:gephyrin-like molybdotransferase Glp [Solirubrobacteraceae bacterium]
MKDLPEATELVLAAAAPLEAERVPLADAAERVAAEEGRSTVDLPPFDRSAMDGYAVRATDTGGGSLRLVGELAAGAVATATLEPGTALGITTGAPIPPGADAVLRSELAELADGAVRATEPVPAGRHVRVRGEDVHAGDLIAPAGEPLTLARVSSLAAAGVGEIAVHRRARLHLFVTGSELLPLGAPPEPGKIHESNGLMVRLLAERAGAQVIDHGVVGDDFESTRAAVETGLGGDVLVASGGVSVGPHDHVKPAFEACGVDEVFWRVRVKPGKPLWFGRRGATLVFGLPGNPLSSIVGFLTLIEPALRRLHGERDPAMRTVRARLTEAAGPSDGRTTFLTSRLVEGADGVLEATPTANQGSHLTGALGQSDGFAIAPHGSGPLPAGAQVDAVRFA